ncbi:MAG: hypothetical protein IAF02_23350, partial [Anaerolineae bacterium]|nr:hypothetical protein [Anaerolineae bacterium]
DVIGLDNGRFKIKRTQIFPLHNDLLLMLQIKTEVGVYQCKRFLSTNWRGEIGKGNGRYAINYFAGIIITAR